jgi:sterol desaturase/sphingolipid hydroxylase (fatty acid hydroxylase superfamily)
MNQLINIEPVFRLGIFAGVFVLMLLLEYLRPRRQLRFGRLARWPGNLIVTMVNTTLARILFPLTAVGFAALLQSRGTGLFNLLDLTGWLPVLLSVIALDLVIWQQHRLFHRIPLLWRLHRMHHTDNDIDVTTGARFHPAEILLSMLIKLAAITLLGAPPVAVLLFEVILNACAMFNHSNFALPEPVDRWLRKFIVTPDMHRVHHSAIKVETNSNFGFCLSIWDRLFSTYIAQPEQGHTGMTIGLQETQSLNAQRIEQMFAEPFINRD